jgi:UDP-N-acetylmuramoyl-tripeptide--D-alanyl-D-alanine ligase
MIMNIAAAHIGSFETIDDIARAKAEIFSGVVPGGYGVINHDDRRYPLLKTLAETAEIDHLLSFGEKRGSDFWLREIEPTDEGSRISTRLRGVDVEIEIGVRGHHMAMNAAAVLGVASLAGADIVKTREAFKRVVATDGRGTIYHKGGSGAMGISIIDESYNANPASMEAALDVLANFDSVRTKRRIAVLGDMLELGKQSKKLHEGLAKPISAAKTDLVYLVGPEMEHLARILPKERIGGHYTDTSRLVEDLRTIMKPGDVLMFKASNRMNFSKVIQDLLE